MVSPESVVYHIGGGTLPQSNPHKTYLNFRNNLFLLYRNLHPEDLNTVILIRIFMDFLSAIRFLLKGSFRDIVAIIKAHFNFYRGIKYCREFRRVEKSYITQFIHREIYNKSIVLEYFLRKKYTFNALKWKYPNQ